VASFEFPRFGRFIGHRQLGDIIGRRHHGVIIAVPSFDIVLILGRR
jgi:hypothetical protein